MRKKRSNWKENWIRQVKKEARSNPHLHVYKFQCAFGHMTIEQSRNNSARCEVCKQEGMDMALLYVGVHTLSQSQFEKSKFVKDALNRASKEPVKKAKQLKLPAPKSELKQSDKEERVPSKVEERQEENVAMTLCKICNSMVPIGRRRSKFIEHLARAHNFTLDQYNNKPTPPIRIT